MIRTLLCDMGNVLVGFSDTLKEERCGALLGLDPAAAAAAFSTDRLQWRYEAGQLGTDEFLAALCAHATQPCSPAEVLRAFCDIFTPIAGMDEVLAAVKARGVRLVLVSNTNVAHIAHVRRRYRDMLALFDAEILSCEVRVMKPDAGFYRQAGQVAECRADQALFTDDITANVEGAKEAGFLVHHFRGIEGFAHALKVHGVTI